MLLYVPTLSAQTYITAGWFGSGLDENVCEAYNFLANNFNPGDEVFFFGFSRGAYTARACAGLVANVGICKDIQMSRFWEMYSIYKSKPRDTPIESTEWGKENAEISDKSEKEMKSEDWITISKGDKTIAPYKVRKGAGAGWLAYCHKPVIKVVGVFDTVGSLGYPVNILVDVTAWNEAYQFHDTDIHPGRVKVFWLQIGREFAEFSAQKLRMHSKPWHLTNAARHSRQRSGTCPATTT